MNKENYINDIYFLEGILKEIPDCFAKDEALRTINARIFEQFKAGLDDQTNIKINERVTGNELLSVINSHVSALCADLKKLCIG